MKQRNDRLERVLRALPYIERVQLLLETMFNQYPREPVALIKGLVELIGAMTRGVRTRGLDVTERVKIANRLRDLADALEHQRTHAEVG